MDWIDKVALCDIFIGLDLLVGEHSNNFFDSLPEICNIFWASNHLECLFNLNSGVRILYFYLFNQKTEITNETVLDSVKIVDDLFLVSSEYLKNLKFLTSNVYFWLVLTILIITSILNITGFIFSDWIFAYLMIILRGLVLGYIKKYVWVRCSSSTHAQQHATFSRQLCSVQTMLRTYP